MDNRVAEHWNSASDRWYENAERTVRQIEESPTIAFPPAVNGFFRQCFPSFQGVRVCVPSSGDNTAAFAFHLLGAKVCSVDISEKQIENARRIAGAKGWGIAFVCDNSMSLEKIDTAAFDLVYTSNGVHVWISDLPAMYGTFGRILKGGGQYVFFETHPMNRPFGDRDGEIRVVKHYQDTGPFDGGIEYAWRMQDFVNGLIRSGFEIREMCEFHSAPGDFIPYDYMYDSEEAREADQGRLYDWKRNPWAALPQCVGMWARKSP